MLKNYLIIAIRGLRRQPGYAAINVFGLGVGMAACLLIGLFVWQERTYDRFHEHADRIFRAWIVEEIGEEAGQRTFINTTTPVIMAPTLKETFADIESAVRIRDSEIVVGSEGHRFEELAYFTDPTFFEVFSFPLLQGDPATALAGPRRVVLTTEAAQHHFPGLDPVGQVLPVDLEGESIPYLVTGIIETPPVASSLQFRLLLPFEDWAALVGPGTRTSWQNVAVQTYVLVREGVSAGHLEALFPSLVQQVVPQPDAGGYSIHLQAIRDLRLGETLPDSVAPVAYRQYLSLLTLIAFFVLAVAAINFVTLSLGQSTYRSREVGLRKSFGARRSQVASQFWGEALVLTGLALCLGLGLAELLTPAFSNLAGVELALRLDMRTVGLILVLLAVVGLGAGAYPAMVLSGFRPIEALKGRSDFSGDRSLLRRGLVVVQFGLAILLIIGTLFVTRQLDFLRSKPLGFDSEQVVVIPTGMAYQDAMATLERFRNTLSGQPSVKAVSASAFALNEEWAWAGYSDIEGVWRTFRLNWGEPDFLEVAGVDLVSGRMLDPALAVDSTHILVNEALVRQYGWESAESALGKSLPSPGLSRFEIVGVVRDFHFASLREEIEPIVYTLSPGPLLSGVSDMSSSTTSLRKLFVRIDAANAPATLATLRRTWETAAPHLPYSYYFLDDAVQALYVQEERLVRIASTASGLAIFIACLGLFGLATLSVTRRRKEIGVRRVLGASTAGLVALLSVDFLKLVGIAFVIAAPLAYLGVSRWLETFAYRIAPGMDVFIVAGLLAVVIAFAAVSYHAARAALADPVDALRYE